MRQGFFPARLQLSPVGIVPPMRHTRIDSCTFDAKQLWILTEIKTLPATGTLSFVKEREARKLPYRPVCLWKHIVTIQIPRIYGTRKSRTVPTSARHLSVSWANSIQSPRPPPTSWRSILILSSHLRLGLPSGLFPSGFPTNTLCTPLSSPIRATCPAHLIRLDLHTRLYTNKIHRAYSTQKLQFRIFHSRINNTCKKCIEIITDFVKQNPAREVNRHSDSQETERILWNSNVHYLVHNSLPYQISARPPVHILMINFNIIFPSNSTSSKLTLYFGFTLQTSVCIYLPYACHMHRPSHPPRCDEPNI